MLTTLAAASERRPGFVGRHRSGAPPVANNPREGTPVAIFASPRGRASTHGDGRVRRIGWGLLGGGVVGALVLAFVPAPYAIERPGPTFDTLGDVQIGQADDPEEVPMISIPDEETYPTAGTLTMLTVNLVGNRESRPDWFEVITAWADPSEAVVPIDAVFPEGQTPEQSEEQSAVEMQNSQKDAIAAALTELGYDLTGTLTVEAFSPDSPSDGILEEGDQILRVNGSAPADVAELRSAIADTGLGTPVALDIRRDGVDSSVEVVPVANPDDDGAPIIGITTATEYDFPFEVRIQLENVGGPSAGMMFALGIIDKLTAGELTGGEDFAGTGTIDAAGRVGPIGGIRQKMYGARDAGAAYFLAPASNCDEVVGHVPDGLSVFSVADLDDSLAVLDAVRTGGDTTSLPVCAAG